MELDLEIARVNNPLQKTGKKLEWSEMKKQNRSRMLQNFLENFVVIS